MEKLIVVDEFRELALTFPQIHQFGDEVDARLDGQDEAGFQLAAQAERFPSELRALGLSVVADINLAEILHIVYVESHHVAQSARHEHGMGTRFHRLHRIAFREAQLLQVIHDHGARLVIDRLEADAGAQGGDGGLVGGYLDVVDVFL